MKQSVKHSKHLASDPYLNKSYSAKTAPATALRSQSLPWYICDTIFNSITDSEIGAVANRDYVVIQLDYFPHSKAASLTRSDLYKAAKK